jgi:hypothetical protein
MARFSPTNLTRQLPTVLQPVEILVIAPKRLDLEQLGLRMELRLDRCT